MARMIYPYTVGAKFAHFIKYYMKYYMKESWVYKYLPFATVLSVPFFMKLSAMFNTPENIAIWDEIHRKELEDHH